MRILPRCPGCGSPVGEGDRFCGLCGRSLGMVEPKQGGDQPPRCVDSRGMNSVTLAGMTAEAIRSMFMSSPVRLTPSWVVYAKRPHRPLKRYLFTAIVFIAFGLFMGYGEAWISYLGYTLAGFSAPIVYLVWMARNDRFEREPVALVAFTFGWGVFCSVFAGLFNSAIVPLLGSPGAAFVEEPLKLLGVYILARNKRLGAEFNDHLDGMVYGAAVGAGFAGLENLSYILRIVFDRGLPAFAAVMIRSATAFCHIAWSSIAGRSLGLAKTLRGDVRLRDMIPGLVVAVPLHFLWNAFPSLVSVFVLLPIFAMVFFRQVKVALEDERTWGFGVLAPRE